MNILLKNSLIAALLAAVVAVPAAAWAQTTTTSAAARPAPGARENVEQRIADMHATLHITAAQEGLWDSFAQVMLDNAQAMKAALPSDPAATAKLTADQRMSNYADIANLHARNTQKLSTAFGMVYDQLKPEQKLAADEMFRESAAAREDRKEVKQGG